MIDRIRKIGISGKFNGMIMGISIVYLLSAVTLGYFMVTKHFSIIAQSSIKGNLKSGTVWLGKAKSALKEDARFQAIRPNVIDGTQKKNAEKLISLGKAIVSANALMEITYVGTDGVVIARGHNDKAGDSVSHQEFFKKAIKGETAEGFETNLENKLILKASAPVYDETKNIIGVVILGNKIFEGNAFVDEVKEMLDGTECTIFDNDTRMTTTIMKEGKRVIGTKMTNPTVLENVLKKGESMTAEIDILGMPYSTGYSAIKDTEGKIIGMFFVGRSMTQVNESRDKIIYSLIIGLSALTLVIIIGGIFFLKFTFVKPILQLFEFSEIVAKGNLDAVLNMKPREDELGKLGDSMKEMVATLKIEIESAQIATKKAEEKTEEAKEATRKAEEAEARAVLSKKEGLALAAEQLEEVVGGISGATEKLEGIGSDLNKAVDFQAARTTEVATAMEEMNSTVLEVARNAGRAAEGSEQAKKQAHEGEKAMGVLVKDMNLVKSQVVELGEMMRGLSVSAKDIDQIINVINDIADQTNLLALNAAIEAARAGDAGRGFAVVADEVRKLAEKTQKATQEVSQTIRAIQEKVEQGGKMVVSANTTVDVAAKSANATGEILVDIVTKTDGAADQIRGIATAAEEQSATSEEINRNIADIHESTKLTHTSVGDAMNMVSDVTTLAATLKHIQGGLRE